VDADASIPKNPNYPTKPMLLADRTFREGVAVLSRLGLSFDAWLYHPQIDDLSSLARAFPAARIALNQVGGPVGIGPYRGKRDGVFAQWKVSIKRLAAHQNVCIKLSGLGQNINGFGFDAGASRPHPKRWPVRFAHTSRHASKPSARRARVESNFPVDKAA
jgi:L-fuconolactonase